MPRFVSRFVSRYVSLGITQCVLRYMSLEAPQCVLHYIPLPMPLDMSLDASHCMVQYFQHYSGLEPALRQRTVPAASNLEVRGRKLELRFIRTPEEFPVAPLIPINRDQG